MSAPLRVAVATGTRAEFGLLRPVMRAVRDHGALELRTIVMGAHWLGPADTWREVEREFGVDVRVEMQREGHATRLDDAAALGRGVQGAAEAVRALAPAWVVVLGDRIEALAAASAASVGGVGVAHLHGGDRAEGVADEAMRHAITKLAHLHLPATAQSEERIARMGEDGWRIRMIGSSSIDGLRGVETMDDASWRELGEPGTALLLHPIGRSDEEEQRAAEAVIAGLEGERVIALAPNRDAGWRGVRRALDSSGLRVIEHMERERFAAMLRRLGREGGALVGNSSAGLIEAAALGAPAVNIGARQAGRERAGNVVDCGESAREVREALARARALRWDPERTPYGDGRAGDRAASALAEIGAPDAVWLRKRCVY